MFSSDKNVSVTRIVQIPLRKKPYQVIKCKTGKANELLSISNTHKYDAGICGLLLWSLCNPGLWIVDSLG